MTADTTSRAWHERLAKPELLEALDELQGLDAEAIAARFLGPLDNLAGDEFALAVRDAMESPLFDVARIRSRRRADMPALLEAPPDYILKALPNAMRHACVTLRYKFDRLQQELLLAQTCSALDAALKQLERPPGSPALSVELPAERGPSDLCLLLRGEAADDFKATVQLPTDLGGLGARVRPGGVTEIRVRPLQTYWERFSVERFVQQVLRVIRSVDDERLGENRGVEKAREKLQAVEQVNEKRQRRLAAERALQWIELAAFRGKRNASSEKAFIASKGDKYPDLLERYNAAAALVQLDPVEREARRWIGFIDSAARRGYLYERGVEEVRKLDLSARPDLQALFDDAVWRASPQSRQHDGRVLGPAAGELRLHEVQLLPGLDEPVFLIRAGQVFKPTAEYCAKHEVEPREEASRWLYWRRPTPAELERFVDGQAAAPGPDRPRG